MYMYNFNVGFSQKSSKTIYLSKENDKQAQVEA